MGEGFGPLPFFIRGRLMTLLTIAQNVAADIGTGQTITSVVGNSSVAQIQRLIQRTGTRIMKMYAWEPLRKEHTFTAIAGETQTGILPTDFDRFMPETLWDRTNKRLISGPIGATEWNSRRAHDDYDSARRKYIHRGGQIDVWPTMAGGESLAFEYVSKYWVDSDGDGTGISDTFTNDTSTPLIDEELITLGAIYEYLRSKSLPAQAAAAAYEERFETLTDNDRPRAKVLAAGDIFGGGRHFTGAPGVNGFEDRVYD